MKKQINLWAFAAVACVFLAPHAAHAQCTNATLSNGWGYLLSGTDLVGVSTEHRTEIGLFTFDGAGHFNLIDSGSIDGTITRWQTSIGTYYVNPDCTGALIVHRDPRIVHFNFTISGDHTTLTLACTDSDAQVWNSMTHVYVSTYTGTATKQ